MSAKPADKEYLNYLIDKCDEELFRKHFEVYIAKMDEDLTYIQTKCSTRFLHLVEATINQFTAICDYAENN